MDNDRKREVFSYISPELQRKNALKVLGIEAIVILIIVVLIFISLNYFGVFKFSDVVKNFAPNAQNTSTTTQTTPKAGQSTSEVAKIPTVPTVQAVSDIPGYSLTLENQEKLLQLLNSWGVFGKEYQSRYGATGSTNEVVLRQIIIHLTDQQQPLFGYINSQTKKVYTSSNTTITKGTFTMNIQISQDTLKSPGPLGPLGGILQQTFFDSIYHIANPTQDKQSAQNVNKSFTDFIVNDPRAKVEYFKIEKK